MKLTSSPSAGGCIVARRASRKPAPHRPCRGPGRPRPDARAHLCRPDRVRVALRQAVRHRRKARARAAARALARDLGRRHDSHHQAAEHVKFHDGEPFDAEAAKSSLERHLTMQGSFRRAEIAQVAKVEVVDKSTIRLQLKAPFAPLIAQLTDRAGMMVSPKAAKAAGDKFGTKPVCAGPYQFVERIAQDRIVVERFADYWDKGKVQIDRIVYQPIQDSTVRLANLKSGGLDLIERMLATDIEEVKKDPKLTLAIGTELGYQGITINVATANDRTTRWRRTRKCGRPSSSRSTATRSIRSCSTASTGRTTNGSARRTRTTWRNSRCRSATSRRRRRSSRNPASRRRSCSTSWCRTTPRAARSPRSCNR